MNARKAKATRKAVREMRRDPREVVLTNNQNFNLLSFSLPERVLRRNCGRALYKALKREVRSGAGA